MNFTAKQIAKILNGEVVGDGAATISSVAKIEDGKEHEIVKISEGHIADIEGIQE